MLWATSACMGVYEGVDGSTMHLLSIELPLKAEANLRLPLNHLKFQSTPSIGIKPYEACYALR